MVGPTPMPNPVDSDEVCATVGKPAKRTVRTATLWWCSPVTVSLIVAVASIVPTVLLDDQQFRQLWRTPKWVTVDTLLLFGCGAAALAFGAAIGMAIAPATRQVRSPWPSLSDRSVRLLRRASTVLTTATLFGYACFAVLFVRAGIGPTQ